MAGVDDGRNGGRIRRHGAARGGGRGGGGPILAGHGLAERLGDGQGPGGGRGVARGFRLGVPSPSTDAGITTPMDSTITPAVALPEGVSKEALEAMLQDSHERRMGEHL